MQLWRDIVSAIVDSDGHLNPDLVRQVVSGLILSTFFAPIVAWIAGRIRDVAQFGNSRFEFADRLTQLHKQIFSCLVDDNGRRRALPGIVNKVQEELIAARELVGEYSARHANALTQEHRHLVSTYTGALDSFRQAIGEGAIWSRPKYDAFLATSVALASLVRKLVRGRVGAQLQKRILLMKVPRGADEAEVHSLANVIPLPSQLLARFKSDVILSRLSSDQVRGEGQHVRTDRSTHFAAYCHGTTKHGGMCRNDLFQCRKCGKSGCSYWPSPGECTNQQFVGDSCLSCGSSDRSHLAETMPS